VIMLDAGNRRALAYLDGIATRKGDMMLMKTVADRRGWEIGLVIDGDDTRRLGPSWRRHPVRNVAEIAESSDDLAALIVPRRDHLGEHLPLILPYTAVLIAATDELLPHATGDRS